MALRKMIKCLDCGEKKEVFESGGKPQTICHECENLRQEKEIQEHLQYLRENYAIGERLERIERKLFLLEKEMSDMRMWRASQMPLGG